MKLPPGRRSLFSPSLAIGLALAAIIGGIAMSQWGVVRATYDVDIKVLVPNYDYTAVRTTLQVQVAFPQPARQHVPQNPLIVAVTIGDVITDFLLALPGYEELIIERAVQRDLDGWSAWICSAEDLIIRMPLVCYSM